MAFERKTPQCFKNDNPMFEIFAKLTAVFEKTNPVDGLNPSS